MLVRIVFTLLMLRVPVPDRVIQHVIAKALAGGRPSRRGSGTASNRFAGL